MRKTVLFKSLSLLTAMCLSVDAMAQTVDEIVSKHVAAMGGKTKYETLKTLYTEMDMELQGMEVQTKIYNINKVGFRQEIAIMGTNNLQVIYKDAGWLLMPVQDINEPVDMPREQIDDLRKELDLSTELFDYAAKGSKLELLGKETVDGQEEYKLKLTDKDGGISQLYVDAASYYITKKVSTQEQEGESEEIETVLGDYRKTPDGFVFPYSIIQEKLGVKVTITKIEVNKPVDESLFKKPVK